MEKVKTPPPAENGTPPANPQTPIKKVSSSVPATGKKRGRPKKSLIKKFENEATNQTQPNIAAATAAAAAAVAAAAVQSGTGAKPTILESGGAKKIRKRKREFEYHDKLWFINRWVADINGDKLFLKRQKSVSSELEQKLNF